MRGSIAVAVLAIAGCVAFGATAQAEDQSKGGDPLLIVTLTEGIHTGMLPGYAKLAASKNVPPELTDRFVSCYAAAMVRYVDTTDKSLWENTPETQNKITTQVLGGMSLDLAKGNDPLVKACPEIAAKFRSYF